jgi:hypothetical protein
VSTEAPEVPAAPVEDEKKNRIVAVVEVEVVKPIGEDRTWEVLGHRLSDIESIAHRLLNSAITDMATVDATMRLAWLLNPTRKGTGKRAPLDPTPGLTDEKKDGVSLRTAANRAVSLALEENRRYWQEEVPKIASALQSAKTEHEARLLRRDLDRAERRAQFTMPGAMASAYADLAFAHYETFRKSSRGEKSLPSFRKGSPILFRSDMVKVSYVPPEGGRPGGYVLRVALGASDNWDLVVVPMGGSAHATMRAVTGGDPAASWKALDCKIVRRKKKWFAKLAYARPRPAFTGDPKVVCAVHLGVRNALTISCSDGRAQILDTGGKLLHVKAQMAARRKRLSEVGKNGSLGGGSRGHGTPTRFSRLEQLEDAEARYTKTQIQQWASACVKRAMMWNAGTIVLEDYSPKELADQAESEYVERLIRKFPLAALRDAIAFAALKAGVRVEKHSAAYISQTCPECGVVDPANDKKDGMFGCVACGHRREVDLVAAVNYVQFFLRGGPPEGAPPPPKPKVKRGRKAAAEAAEGSV